MFCSFEFAFAMSMLCYFIGFFFGRLTKKYAKKQNNDSDGFQFYQGEININDTFLVNVKTGKYDFRGNLLHELGREEVGRMLAYGELVHEDKWLEMKKKNECRTYEDIVKRDG